MSQIELFIIDFLNKNPDIRGARDKKLINRRALARYIISNSDLNKNQIEAVIATLRRTETKQKEEIKDLKELFKKIVVSTKDRIAILSLPKNDEVINEIINATKKINSSHNETLKIVEGTQSIKLFIDEKNIDKIGINQKNILKTKKNLAEISALFPESAVHTKGIVSFVTAELVMEKINLIELITCTPELIIYVEEKDLLKVYEVLRRMQGKV